MQLPFRRADVLACASRLSTPDRGPSEAQPRPEGKTPYPVRPSPQIVTPSIEDLSNRSERRAGGDNFADEEANLLDAASDRRAQIDLGGDKTEDAIVCESYRFQFVNH